MRLKGLNLAWLLLIVFTLVQVARTLDVGVRLARRDFLIATTASFSSSLFNSDASASSSTSTAFFTAGDPRFLQPKFDELSYAGITLAEVGYLNALPSLKVTYDPTRFPYKRVLGTFWRSCDPTSSSSQFGDPYGPIIWASTPSEMSEALESRERLQKSTQYKSSTFGPMYKGKSINTEVRELGGGFVWEVGPGDSQNWYKTDPNSFAKLLKKSGREKFFIEQFKPVTVTACEVQPSGGSVCGFVYFPCSEENGCSDVMKGAF
ncbi:hypothetical protein TrST_g12198 [Triparma strigata]|uniref:peptide-methionine (S)-S-oxide reductase n=1 Tax=Triparma strigata TaxID=1606541 RepID=A0A9W7DTS7_9STRA|nr:hypothetical protein TrST_g12198 [Triparma strigata]